MTELLVGLVIAAAGGLAFMAHSYPRLYRTVGRWVDRVVGGGYLVLFIWDRSRIQASGAIMDAIISLPDEALRTADQITTWGATLELARAARDSVVLPMDIIGPVAVVIMAYSLLLHILSYKFEEERKAAAMNSDSSTTSNIPENKQDWL